MERTGGRLHRNRVDLLVARALEVRDTPMLCALGGIDFFGKMPKEPIGSIHHDANKKSADILTV
jgi:hypothetical protein